jgi:hypothetical protein
LTLGLPGLFFLLDSACSSNGSSARDEGGVSDALAPDRAVTMGLFDAPAFDRSITMDARAPDGSEPDASIESSLFDAEVESGGCIDMAFVASELPTNCSSCLAANNCCYEYENCPSCVAILDCVPQCNAHADASTNCYLVCASESKSSPTAAFALEACAQTRCIGDAAANACGP